MSESLEQRPLDRGALLRSRQWVAIVALCLVALLVVMAAMWMGGGSDVDGLPASAQTDDEAVEDLDDADEGTTDAEPDAVEALPTETYEVYLARDPFEPVRTPPAEDAATDDDDDTIVVDPDDPDDPSDPSDPGSPTDPSDPDDPASPGDPADPDDPESPTNGGDERCTGDEEEAVCNGQVVSLMDITTVDGQETAVIQVDTTVYEVRPREGFAERFQLLSIDRDAGSVEYLFGDVRYELRLGERTLK